MKIEIDIDKAKSLYESGMTLADVAEEFDVSGYCIRKRFLEAGIPRRKAGGKGIKQTQAQPARMCSCCVMRPVPPDPVCGVKLTRLCIDCYRAGENRREDI